MTKQEKLKKLEYGTIAYASLSEEEKKDKDVLYSACKFNIINFMVAPQILKNDRLIVDKLFELDPKVMLMLPRKMYLDVDYMKTKIEKINNYYRYKLSNASPDQMVKLFQEQNDIIKKIASYYDLDT